MYDMHTAPPSMKMATAREIVARGATYFDQQYPGWEQKLDGKEFNVSEATNCPLFHVDGDYSRGLDLFKQRASSDWLTAGYGFWGQQGIEVGYFNAAWRDEVIQRLAADRRGFVPMEVVPEDTRELITA